MAKYLFKVSYTTQGMKGVLTEGGSARQMAAEKVAQSLGGRVESMYFAFGDTDVFVIGDMPDAAAAAALAMQVSAAGGATVTTVPLLMPADIDQAAHMTADYRAPGA